MTRPTPFDLVFAPVAERLDALTAAARAAGCDPWDRTAFARIPDVQRLIGELEVPALLARHPEAAEEYLVLTHAAYCFHVAGRRVVVTTRSQLEPWLDRRPPASAPAIPGNACYVQLPSPWIWAQVGEDVPHEPLDGIFAVATPAGAEITLVAVLGLRAERGGFTQVTLRARPADFTEARALRREPPFAPLMEGGPTAGFRSIASGAELLTLFHLALLSTTG